MRFTVPASIVLGAFLASATTARGVGNLDTSGLNHDELGAYWDCRHDHFMSASCGAVLSRVCQVASNKSDWDCIASDFEDCSRADYATPTCELLLERVCTMTGDQYSDACDRYRYETCGRTDFAAIGCDATRLRFTLPTLAAAIEAEATGTETRDRHTVETLAIYRCASAHGDATNPLFRSCSPTHAEAPMDIDGFDAAYREAGIHGALTSAAKLVLLRRLLSGPLSGDPFDQAEAANVWLREDEDTAGSDDPTTMAVRAAAMAVLGERGDDSVTATMLLVEAARDDVSAVRAAALRGLGGRSYSSGLAVLALMQGMRAETAGERSAAYAGLARRWRRDLQSSYLGRLDAKQLGSLLDCRGVRLDNALYDHVRTMTDVLQIDLTDPKVLCGIGQGARLFQLKEEVWSDYLRLAGDAEATSEERMAALEGLALIAPGDDVTVAQAHDLARSVWAVVASADLRRAALALLHATTSASDHPEVKRVFEAMTLELRGQLDAATPDLAGVRQLLEMMRDAGFLGGLDDGGAVSVNNALPDVRDRCIAREDATPALRALCFAAVSAALDSTVEDAFWPLLPRLLTSPVFAERDAGLTLIESGAITFIDADGTTLNCARREELARAVAAETARILGARLGGLAPLLNRYWTTVTHLTVGSEELTRCPRLAEVRADLVATIKRREIFDWLAASIAGNMPRLPMRSWYDAYQPTNRVDVVERVDVPHTHGDPYHGYKPRKTYVDQVEQAFAVRAAADMVARDEAWAGLRAAYAAAMTGADSVEPDLQILFWGVTNPKSTTGGSHR